MMSSLSVCFTPNSNVYMSVTYLSANYRKINCGVPLTSQVFKMFEFDDISNQIALIT